MERPPHESARSFGRAYTLWSSAPGIIGALLIVAYFTAVLDLGGDGWRTLGWAILVQSIAMSFVGQAMQRRIARDIVHALERHAAGDLTREETLRAYVAARSLPQRAMRMQIWSFGSSAALCTVAMKLAVPDSLAFTLIVIGVGALTGGAACPLPLAMNASSRRRVTGSRSAYRRASARLTPRPGRSPRSSGSRWSPPRPRRSRSWRCSDTASLRTRSKRTTCG
jgi:hypothetical protein